MEKIEKEINNKKVVNYNIFLFYLLIFFHHSSCRKDQFTALILKFGTQDFTPADPHWFVVVVLP